MATVEKPQGTFATVIATAAVTLAVGITAAALGGILLPGRAANEKAAAPNVVFVPVAPDLPGPSASPAPADEVILAGYEPARDHDDRRHGHDHRGRKHGHDHHDED